MRRTPIGTLALFVAVLLPLRTLAAEPTDCDHSESKTYPSPDKRWAANVQEQVCATDKGAAAGITVLVAPPDVPALSGKRVVMIAVPRSRDAWPRPKWSDARTLEVWVPNLANVVTTVPEYQGIKVALKYCGDNPDDRARVAGYKDALKRWMQETTAWVERRKRDPELAGPRPQRPEEPRVPPGLCNPADF